MLNVTKCDTEAPVTKKGKTVFSERLQRFMDERGKSTPELAREIWGETVRADGRTEARGRQRITRVVVPNEVAREVINLLAPYAT